MLKKSYFDDGIHCEVYFEFQAGLAVKEVCLLGDFNDWQTAQHPMRNEGNGKFSLSLPLELGRCYGFRYLIDGENWENDATADRYEANPYGSENSILDLS